MRIFALITCALLCLSVTANAQTETLRGTGNSDLVSIWDMDGALVVYDAKTLKEVKRISMVKPSGKYNVFSKITLSAGTSH